MIDKLQFYDFNFESFVELSRFEQRRKHKRPRINKKWRKRYGFINERFTLPLAQFTPKYFKKYQKQYFVRGDATPKQPVIKYPIMPQMPVMMADVAPTAYVSYDVEVIELKRCAMQMRILDIHYTHEAAEIIKRELTKAINGQISQTVYSDEIIGDILDTEFVG